MSGLVRISIEGLYRRYLGSVDMDFLCQDLSTNQKQPAPAIYPPGGTYICVASYCPISVLHLACVQFEIKLVLIIGLL